MSRRKGRIIAFQALHSWDVTKEPLEDLLSFTWLQKTEGETEDGEPIIKEFNEDQKEEQTFASLIIAGTIEHIKEIDETIESHLSSTWTLERINKVTLAILRTSVYQILFQPDANIGIIINEAVNISREYGTDDSYKFINAVLDKIGKDESEKK